jgi:hypothetical protein
VANMMMASGCEMNIQWIDGSSTIGSSSKEWMYVVSVLWPMVMHGVVYYLDSTVITVGNDLMELAAKSLILLLLPQRARSESLQYLATGSSIVQWKKEQHGHVRCHIIACMLCGYVCHYGWDD